MKQIILFLIISYNVSGQSFYKSFSKPDFQGLLNKGLYYLKSGDSIKDALYISAIENNWDVTNITILESIESSNKFSGDEVFLTEAAEEGSSDSRMLGLIQLNHIIKGEIIKYNFIGFIEFDGYDQLSEGNSKTRYIDQTISGLNDVIQSIKDNKISKIGNGLYSSIYISILPKSKALKNKTLLILGTTDEYIDLPALKKAGINYKKISVAEYEDMKAKDDLSDYCLMYFAYNAYTDISIYDLENNELIFTRHFWKSKPTFTTSDIKAMMKYW